MNFDREFFKSANLVLSFVGDGEGDGDGDADVVSDGDEYIFVTFLGDVVRIHTSRKFIMASDLSSWCIEIHLFTDWVNSPTRSFPLISGNDIYVPCWFLYILYNGEIASMFSKLLMLIFHCAKFDACWRISCARGLVTWLMKCSESVLSMYFTFDINRWNSCFGMCLCLIMSMVVDSFSWMRNETSKELDALFKNLFICSRSGVYYFQIEF